MAGLENSTPVDTPLEVNAKLSPDKGDPLPDPMLYCHLVDSLVYLIITHPDISYAVILAGRLMMDP